VSDRQNKFPQKVIAYTDGASRGNPGPASLGVFITDVDGKVVSEIREKLGIQTNNFAEYSAMIKALATCKDASVEEIHLRADSEFMIKQMRGEYKVKSDVIIPLYQQARKLSAHFKKVIFEHVRREQNKEADRLANEALDGLYK
jgi:ribonuclease HI